VIPIIAIPHKHPSIGGSQGQVYLVARCTGSYAPEGLQLWLPVEKRYGVWDSSHCGIQVFGPEVTWERIAADPVPHINAGWTGIDRRSPKMTDLVPWPSHPYGDRQVYSLQTSYAGPAADVAGRVRGHRGIESGLHWVLDVVFGEGDSRVRAGHAGANLAVRRRVAVALLKRAPAKGRRRRNG
jgi:hypothetical protein